MKLEDRFRKVVPYTPGEQPRGGKVIKLNTNESPYPPSPAFFKAKEELKREDFRLYPDTEATAIVQALSEVYHMPPDQIFVGVGSDEVLGFAFLAFFSEGGTLLFPDVTYSFYPVWADLYGIPYRKIRTDENFRIPRAELVDAADAGGIIFPNPNAPTGILEPVDFVEEIVAAHPDAVVIVDEAYIDFGGQSVLPLVEKYENLLVVQTCSKSRALAGLRLGFAFGSKKLIDALRAVKFSFNSYTMNHASIEPGAAAIRDTEYFGEMCARIISTRTRMVDALTSLGFSFPPSAANFLFAKHERLSGREIFDALRQRGILVRRWDQERIADYLRITVGSDEEVDALIAALRAIVS